MDPTATKYDREKTEEIPRGKGTKLKKHWNRNVVVEQKETSDWKRRKNSAQNCATRDCVLRGSPVNLDMYWARVHIIRHTATHTPQTPTNECMSCDISIYLQPNEPKPNETQQFITIARIFVQRIGGAIAVNESETGKILHSFYIQLLPRRDREDDVGNVVRSQFSQMHYSNDNWTLVVWFKNGFGQMVNGMVWALHRCALLLMWGANLAKQMRNGRLLIILRGSHWLASYLLILLESQNILLLAKKPKQIHNNKKPWLRAPSLTPPWAGSTRVAGDITHVWELSKVKFQFKFETFSLSICLGDRDYLTCFHSHLYLRLCKAFLVSLLHIERYCLERSVGIAIS